MAGIDFKEIANRLTAEQFARRYLRMKGNRAVCPFHDGEHFNLAFYRDGRCYCHSCHKGGDVVALAAATWHTSVINAAHMLNDEFHLGVPTGGPGREIVQQRQREKAQAEADAQRRGDEWAARSDAIIAACEAVKAARFELMRYTEADVDKPEFVAAMARCAAAINTFDKLTGHDCLESMWETAKDYYGILESGVGNGIKEW